jgi:hypothetical protein
MQLQGQFARLRGDLANISASLSNRKEEKQERIYPKTVAGKGFMPYSQDMPKVSEFNREHSKTYYDTRPILRHIYVFIR